MNPSNTNKDYHKVLGLDANATPEQIKKAYQEKVKAANYKQLQEQIRKAKHDYREATEAYHALTKKPEEKEDHHHYLHPVTYLANQLANQTFHPIDFGFPNFGDFIHQHHSEFDDEFFHEAIEESKKDEKVDENAPKSSHYSKFVSTQSTYKDGKITNIIHRRFDNNGKIKEEKKQEEFDEKGHCVTKQLPLTIDHQNKAIDDNKH